MRDFTSDTHPITGRDAALTRGELVQLAAAGLAMLARVLWHAIRLPVLALLIVLEPIVRTLLILASVLGLFTALFFEFLSALSAFPFWEMLALSAGAALVLLGYYGLIRLFSLR